MDSNARAGITVAVKRLQSAQTDIYDGSDCTVKFFQEKDLLRRLSITNTAGQPSV